jgi:HYR domain-containing protein
MRRFGVVVALALIAVPSASAGSLQLDATINTSRTPGTATDCPPGAPATALCAKYTGATASIRGLGDVTSHYTKIITSQAGTSDCEVILRSAVLEVEGEGTIELSTNSCWRFALPASVGPFPFTITRGTGSYAGATGTLMWSSAVAATPPGSRDSWVGTISVSGYEFDVTPPSFSGARSKLVRVQKKVKRVRVRYAVKAADEVDGGLLATCEPASGSFFRVGRTRVTCSAIDSSANVAEVSFTVTVKRRR